MKLRNNENAFVFATLFTAFLGVGGGGGGLYECPENSVSLSPVKRPCKLCFWLRSGEIARVKVGKPFLFKVKKNKYINLEHIMLIHKI